MKDIIIECITGVSDLCRIGYLNLLKNAKRMCDKLIVGVTVGDLVIYKVKKTLIPFNVRIEMSPSCVSENGFA